MERISVEEVYANRESYVSELVVTKPFTLPIPRKVFRAYIQNSEDLAKYVAEFGDNLVEWIDGQYEVRAFEKSIMEAHRLVSDHCKTYGCE